MDARMAKAAATRNVENLKFDETLLLDSVALLGAQTPMHICWPIKITRKVSYIS